MFSFLKNHPFSVDAFFEKSIVLTFAVPKDELLKLIPPFLELDTYDDKYAFIAVAYVTTKNLRPSFLPNFLANDFTLIGYRIFVRYTSNSGSRKRGLYILKSATNNKKMEILGSIFTQYNYETIDISEKFNEGILSINSQKSELKIELSLKNTNVLLPIGSPFKEWKEAQRFAGPMPFTFSCIDNGKKILLIEGTRKMWKPVPIEVINYKVPFLDSLNLRKYKLANAFIIENVPYHWKKGVIENV